MHGIVKLSISRFLLIYLLLIIVLLIMKKSNVNKTKLLIVASLRMSVQLVIVGYILQYIFGNPNPLFTITFLAVIIAFSINRVIKSRKDLNRKFKLAIGISLAFPGLFVLFFFVGVVVNKSIFNPQYTISLAGMMTGQMLSGTLPTTAIMYQIAIMIAICTSVCITVFLSLNLGYKSLYNNRKQFL